MAKCMNHWVDPAHIIGPYMCGRKPGHPGPHAWDGNGASALWRDGELLFAVQQIREGT